MTQNLLMTVNSLSWRFLVVNSPCQWRLFRPFSFFSKTAQFVGHAVIRLGISLAVVRVTVRRGRDLWVRERDRLPREWIRNATGSSPSPGYRRRYYGSNPTWRWTCKRLASFRGLSSSANTITWSCGIRFVIVSVASRAGAACGRIPNPFPGWSVPLSHPQVPDMMNSDEHYSRALINDVHLVK